MPSNQDKREWPEVVLTEVSLERLMGVRYGIEASVHVKETYVPKSRLEEVEAERDEALSAVLKESEREARIEELEAQLAECYRISGADPDGDSDSHLAKHAVQAVRELREESDRNCAEELALREASELRADLLQATLDNLGKQEVVEAAELHRKACLDGSDQTAMRFGLQAALTKAKELAEGDRS